MKLLFYPILLRLVLASLYDRPIYQSFGFSVITLVNASRCLTLSSIGEDGLHTLAYNLLLRDESSDLSVLYTLSIAKKEYILYLQRIREKSLSRENVGKLVEELTQRNVYGYHLFLTSIDMVKETIKQASIESFEVFSDSPVHQEYFECSRTALGAYLVTLYDYKKNIRFPYYQLDGSIPQSLGVVADFIGTKLVKFDKEATYPDAVMCLSFLQYHKYAALGTSQLNFLETIRQQYDAILPILKNMRFKTRRRKQHAVFL